jgi:tetratricopeptide (TPR) repeat protein
MKVPKGKPTRKEKFSKQQQQHEHSSAEKQKIQSIKKTVWLLAAIVAVTGFLLYANTLNHGYALDDYSVIKDNRLTRQGWGAFPEAITKSYRYGYYFVNDELYRPVVKALFAIQWALAPDTPALGHVTNVVFYSLTGLLLMYVLFLYSGSALFSFLASMLFIAHPVHTEVVANIKSIDEILSLFFLLLVFLFIHRRIYQPAAWHLPAAMVCYLISLFSKESGITFLAVFPVMIWYFTKAPKTLNAKISLMLLGVALLFLMIRFKVLEGNLKTTFSIADNLLMAAKTGTERFATAVSILGRYLWVLVFPYLLVFDASYNQIPIIGPGNIRFIIPFIVYLLLALLVIIFFRKKERWVFGIYLFLVSISIFSNIILTIGTSYGERLMYLPSLGYCMAIAGWLSKLPHKSEAGKPVSLIAFFSSSYIPLGLMLVIVVLYSIRTITRNPVWKNNHTLFSHDVNLSPNSTRTHYYWGNYMIKPENLGVTDSLQQIVILDSAIKEMNRALAIFPGFCDVYKQLGVAYGKKNEIKNSFDHYVKAIECNPTDPPSHSNIGTIYFEQKNYPEALKAFHKAVSLDPNYTEALANLGSTYGMMKDYDNALKYLHQCIRTDPQYTQAYFFLAITYRFKGDKANENFYMQKYKELGGK